MVARRKLITETLFHRCCPNVSDTMVDIIVDGPQPMVEGRPANRIRNGAELFDDTHQAEYESRGQQTSDLMARVRYHNQNYPVMYNELNRKKSIIRVSMENIIKASANSQTTSDDSSRYNKPKVGRICKRKYRKSLYYTVTNKACQSEMPKHIATETKEVVPECSRYLSKTSHGKEGKKGASRVDVDREKSRPSIDTFNSVVSFTNEPMVAKCNYYS